MIVNWLLASFLCFGAALLVLVTEADLAQARHITGAACALSPFRSLAALLLVGLLGCMGMGCLGYAGWLLFSLR